MKLGPLIYVSDLQKSVSFYEETLGFRLGEFYPNKEKATYATVFISEDKLRLCLAKEGNTKFYQRIKDKVEIFDGLETKPWGDREFTLKDTDGYLISFFTPV
jgi:catechol 2,3-dioxygenase-like lactoylglutathione lyase family enzyme